MSAPLPTVLCACWRRLRPAAQPHLWQLSGAWCAQACRAAFDGVVRNGVDWPPSSIAAVRAFPRVLPGRHRIPRARATSMQTPMCRSGAATARARRIAALHWRVSLSSETALVSAARASVRCFLLRAPRARRAARLGSARAARTATGTATRAGRRPGSRALPRGAPDLLCVWRCAGVQTWRPYALAKRRMRRSRLRLAPPAQLACHAAPRRRRFGRAPRFSPIVAASSGGFRDIRIAALSHRTRIASTLHAV